ncbi:MAG: hypothetical protein EOO04_34485 [Chitinophagaceae bacterium]|nr:MAG: hypothetical protein EOO04_34485 [Chitinophagaceae bacterium]
MNTATQQPVAIACLFTWIGFVCAISFMEAWLKFRAPGVTIPIGLGIGKLVFGALNKVEWVLAIVVVVSAALYNKRITTVPNISLLIVIVILVVQTAWLLPTLQARADLHIQHKPADQSNLHNMFVGAEFIKVFVLFITAFSLFKQPSRKQIF